MASYDNRNQLWAAAVVRYRAGSARRQDRPGSTAPATPRPLHLLRHTMASQMLDGGVPLPAVSARLGHSSIRTTAEI